MLDLWLPRLVATWRRLRGSAGQGTPAPAAPLTAAERADIVAGAQRLSRGLTRERELAGARYFEDPQLLGAYLLLYWPLSYAQATSILRELGGARGRVLDVGAGPAPMALAALDAGAREVLAVDRSPAALEVARALAPASLTTARWEPSRPLPDGPFDLILAGHVLNELGDSIDARVRLVESMLARLAPTGASSSSSRRCARPRARSSPCAIVSCAAGAAVLAPCLYRGNCPALVREGDWCHAERGWTVPPRRRRAGPRRQAASRDAEDELPRARRARRRLAGAPRRPPLSHRLRAAAAKGAASLRRLRTEGRVPLILPHKHVTDANRAFVDLARGDVIRIDRLTPRGDGLRLDAESPVERLAGADEPIDKF